MKRVGLIFGSILVVIAAFGGTYLVLRSQQQPVDAPARQVVTSTKGPDLAVTKVVDGLSHPWEVVFLPGESMLFTERSGVISLFENDEKRELLTPDDVVARGEGGMLGLAVDPEFTENQFIYACFNSSESGNLDVRVVRWKVDDDKRTLTDRNDIVTGIPAAESGRHSGCRIGFGPEGNLWVGTGDAADHTQPQNQATLGGKILRVDRDGKAVEGNPTGPDTRVFSYGHRNTQGLAFYDEQQGDGSYGVSVEHGPDRDDEVNKLVPGNFGWGPGVGYDESVDMTDTDRYPGSIESVWSSGESTIAPSDTAFLSGSTWGKWEGWLALGVLKDQHLRLLKIENGEATEQVESLNNEYGRIRGLTLGPDNALYMTTDNGTNDGIYRIELK